MNSDYESLDIAVTRLADEFNHDYTVVNELYENTQSHAFILVLMGIVAQTSDPVATLAVVNRYLADNLYSCAEIDATSLLDTYRKMLIPQEQLVIEHKCEKTYFPNSCTRELNFNS